MKEMKEQVAEEKEEVASGLAEPVEQAGVVVQMAEEVAAEAVKLVKVGVAAAAMV
jgi:phage-related minor tail protein